MARIFLFIASFLAYLSVSSACHSFKDVEVTANLLDGSQIKDTINGCLERKAFEDGDKKVTEVFIKDQSLPILHKDSIRHLIHLKKLSICETDLHTVEPELFRNVPKLDQVYMKFSNLTEVREGIFNVVPTLVHLRLNNNNISNIEDRAFADLPLLKKVIIGYNRLTVYKSNWFSNSEAIEYLDFKHNAITELPANSFVNMRRLKELNFDFNEISTIKPDAFKGVTSLNYLGLRRNKLTTLEPSFFDRDFVVYSFNIGANHLNYLSTDLRSRIRIEELIHDGNPWNCVCMDEIIVWLNEVKGSMHTSDDCDRSDIPVCSFPTMPSASCPETTDPSIRREFINELKAAVPVFDPECYRDLS